MIRALLRKSQAVPAAKAAELLESLALPMRSAELALVWERVVKWYPSRVIRSAEASQLVMSASYGLIADLPTEDGFPMLLYFRAAGRGYAGDVAALARGEDSLSFGGRTQTVTISAPEALYEFRRREYDRTGLSPRLHGTVILSDTTRARPIVVEDMSIRGARMRLVERADDHGRLPELPQTLGLTLLLPGDRGPLDCMAEVVWSKDTVYSRGESCIVLGIAWPDLPDEMVERLSVLLEEERRSRLRSALTGRGQWEGTAACPTPRVADRDAE